MSKIRIICFFCTVLTAINISCTKEEEYKKSEGMIWNTTYHITYKGPKSLQDSILPVLNEVGKSMSVFDKHSLVSILNSGDSIKADIHLKTIYDISKKINLLSQGRFDPTLAPLIDAWGFGIGHKESSDTLAIDSILQYIGINKTFREGDIIYKEDSRTKFNFSAIAKGYGCDAVGEMFKRNGVKDYMVEIGGEISLKGNSPSGTDWKIGIDSPEEGRNPGEETVVILKLSNCGVATSGNYRNYREEGGRKTAHTISPKTGRPYFSEILSATVIAETCMEADGLATACMAGSLEEAKELLEKYGAEGMMILGDSVWMSRGFRAYLDKNL